MFAGGDPWKVNSTLQSGRPAAISDLAQAFHGAGVSTKESDDAFGEALRRFEASWNRENGEHPINDSAEVQRVKNLLGQQSQQLPKIAVDLESIAATLAQAQRTCSVLISTLETRLQTLDDCIGQAEDLIRQDEYLLTQTDDDDDLADLEDDISELQQYITDCEHEAIDDTKSTLAQLQSIQAGYADYLQKAEVNLRTDGYDPAAIQAVDGENLLDGVDQPGSSPAVPLAPSSERTHNQEEAFKKVYGHEPVTANDWRMAAALDPHSYDPKYHGVPAQIVAGRFTPQPGKGVVRSNVFIPTDQVLNTAKDLDDVGKGRIFPMNLGDNRGPSATADPEASRVSMFVDYDHGIIAFRQNPTVNVDGQRGGAAAGTPKIHVVQAPDGRMTIDYNAYDAYENPVGKTLGLTVNGRVTLSPQGDGTVALGGNTTIYPSMETYQYRDGLAPSQLQWTPANSGSEYGPGTSLSRHHWIGDATIPSVRPNMPGWLWEFENANPFGGDPFLSHTTQLTNPFQGSIPNVAAGR